MRISRPLVAAFIAAAALGIAAPAAAQWVLTPLDEQQQPDSFERHLDQQSQAFDDRPTEAPGGQRPAWIIAPRIDLRESITDNVRDTLTGKTADLITEITPGIHIDGETPWLQAYLDYAPTFVRLVNATEQNRIDQNLFGNATATVVPDSLFLVTRGSMFETSRSGGFGSQDALNLNKNDRTQVITYSASPVWRVPLTDGASGELRYQIGQTIFDSNTGINTTTPFATNAPISNATSQELRAVLDSGQSIARLTSRLILDGMQTNFSHSAPTIQQSEAALDNEFKLTDVISILGNVGYQIIDYHTQGIQNVHGLTWLAGLHYTPDRESSITISYGHRNGNDVFQGDLRYALTPATSVYATYTDGVTTSQQEILGNLANATQTANGQIVDIHTGLPILLANPNLSLQNQIFRSQNLTGGLVMSMEPNRITATFQHVTQTPLGNFGTTRDESNGGTLSWERRLAPLTSASLLAGYFVRSVNNDATFTAAANLTHTFTNTLFGGATYTFVRRDSSNQARVFTRNSLTLSMRKIF